MFLRTYFMFESDNAFLDTEELALVKSKSTAENHLVFAVMLKFFQLEGRYPTQTDIFSEKMIASLASQLTCNTIDFSHYNWINRTAKRFRQEIRAFFNYNKATDADSEKLTLVSGSVSWLVSN